MLQVIDAADVILEVLDARDPLGSRCIQMEEAVLASGATKKLVLLLNKIGSKHTHLYYYRSAVRKNLSSKFDEFLAGRSQFDTDHRVDFYGRTCCHSATFGTLFLFYCPFFFTEKNN